MADKDYKAFIVEGDTNSASKNMKKWKHNTPQYNPLLKLRLSRGLTNQELIHAL